MLKFLFRALFTPSYRHKAKSNTHPVKATSADDTVRGISASSAQPKAPQSNTPAMGEAFDETTAHSVTPPRVLEGPAYVTDGDTIAIQKTQVRLYGIDAPELHHPYGKKAKWAMVNLCKGHKIRARLLMKTNMAAQSQSASFLMVVTFPRKWLSSGSLSTGRSSQVVNTVISRLRGSARNFGLPMHVRKAACVFGKSLTRKRTVKAREIKERLKANTHQQVRLIRCSSRFLVFDLN